MLILIVIRLCVLPHFVSNESLQHLSPLCPVHAHEHLLELAKHLALGFCPANSVIELLSWHLVHIRRGNRLLHGESKLLLLRRAETLLFFLDHGVSHPTVHFCTDWP